MASALRIYLHQSYNSAMLNQQPRITLREALATNFNFEELRDLCFALSVDIEVLNIYQQGKITWVEEIIRFFQRSDALQRLREKCASLRPKFDWQNLPVPDLPPPARVTYLVENAPNPYLGLKPFSYEHRHVFAGRERAIQAIVASLIEPGLQKGLAFVTGASGSGTSSFVQAGVVPALEAHYAQRGQTVKCVVIQPGMRPRLRLDDALAQFSEADGVGILVIDQFEELYTQSISNQRAEVLQWLAQLPDSAPLIRHVIVTLRSDYLKELTEIEPLWKVAKDAFVLRAMSVDEIKSAILRPFQVDTQLRDKQFEPELVEKLAQDAAEHESYLPLLQVTLDSIWKKGRLTLAIGLQVCFLTIKERVAEQGQTQHSKRGTNV